MKIIRLYAENVKRLDAVEITPTDNLVTITGSNGQGKSSVLDSILFALGGKKAQASTPKPIREGQITAKVELDLGEEIGVGDLTVTRTWTEKGETLVVRTADGAAYPSPQAFLDDLVGNLSIDLMTFVNMDAKTLGTELMKLIDLPFDLEELAEERKELYESRTVVNRMLNQLKAQIKAADDPFEINEPLPEPSFNEIRAKEAKAREAVARKEAARNSITADEGLIERYTRQIDELRLEIEEAQARIKRNQAFHDEVGIIPLDLIEEEFAAIEEQAKQVRLHNSVMQLTYEAIEREEEANGLTEQIKALDEARDRAFQEAKMPIPGLAISDIGVTYNGVPFVQCSDAERRRVSIAIAMALNPTLRVLRLTDGSLLDAANMKLIEQMAKDADYQIWIERVDESGVGVVIHDGRVIAPEVDPI